MTDTLFIPPTDIFACEVDSQHPGGSLTNFFSTDGSGSRAALGAKAKVSEDALVKSKLSPEHAPGLTVADSCLTGAKAATPATETLKTNDTLVCPGSDKDFHVLGHLVLTQPPEERRSVAKRWEGELRKLDQRNMEGKGISCLKIACFTNRVFFCRFVSFANQRFSLRV